RGHNQYQQQWAERMRDSSGGVGNHVGNERAAFAGHEWQYYCALVTDIAYGTVDCARDGKPTCSHDVATAAEQQRQDSPTSRDVACLAGDARGDDEAKFFTIPPTLSARSLHDINQALLELSTLAVKLGKRKRVLEEAERDSFD
ncbi:hypothetical protein KEM52_000769, partial [Ascosphaera acerosa]